MILCATEPIETHVDVTVNHDIHVVGLIFYTAMDQVVRLTVGQLLC